MVAQNNQTSLKPSDDKKKPDTTSVRPALPKEVEPAAAEKKILTEIVKSSEAADEQAEKAIQEAIAEARLAVPSPKLAPDVADSGVKSPQQEANEVITKGSTITLPMEEEEYRRALHQKVAGAVVNKVVYGVSSLFALATWVGKMIKFAHKHALRAVFRKE